MSAFVFNVCLFAGWLLLSVGAWLVAPWFGLFVAGGALLLLTMMVAHMGGVHPPQG